jgi:hypothetical protein
MQVVSWRNRNCAIGGQRKCAGFDRRDAETAAPGLHRQTLKRLEADHRLQPLIMFFALRSAASVSLILCNFEAGHLDLRGIPIHHAR